jgi:NSS family neurotransmitter:Na+ symporter
MALDPATPRADEPRFSSRLALFLSVLSIAVGTGNIWRFPRIVAQNGSDEGAGGFLVAWFVCLLIWSIPLIIAEYALGQRGRMGPIGTFARLTQGRFAWMGAFVAFVPTAIMFYYSVVTGWCFYYLGQSVGGTLPASHEVAVATWDAYQGSVGPLLTHALAIGLAALVCLRGVKSIERVTMVLMPMLLVIVVIALVRALTLPGAGAGLDYLFSFNAADLARPTVWLDALTQNAWDTGAGWGLILVYAAYMRPEHGVVRNGVLTGVGNNTVSMLAAMTIFGTVFAILGAQMPPAEVLGVMRDSGPASTGLTFMWIPQLFAQMPLGRPLAVGFFLALSAAAFTSLISMVELATRVLIDFGVPRARALVAVAAAGFLLGVPSALNLSVFTNQDNVWGVGLMVSGAFVAFVTVRYGIERLRREVASPTDWRLPRVWDVLIRWVVPLLAVILLVWWLSFAFEGRWYDPIQEYSIGTFVVQWGLLLVLVIAFNRWMARRTEAVAPTQGLDVYPDPPDAYGLPPTP